MSPRPSRPEPIHARRFPAGEVILRQDVLPAFLHVVLHGLVKLSMVGFDGEEAVVGLVGTGEVFGEAVLLSHDGRAPRVLPAARAIVQTLVGFVPWAWLGDGTLAFEPPPAPAM